MTLRQKERLERLWKRYAREALPLDLPEIVAERLDVDLVTSFGPLKLRNPFVVGAGEMTQEISQIEKAAQAGWGAVILRTVAAEDSSGMSSLEDQRAKLETSGTPSTYEPSDKRRNRPVVRWHGRLDARRLDEYIAFVRSCAEAVRASQTQVIGSFLGQIPREGETLREEWTHTATQLHEAGSDVLEIPLPADFDTTSAEEAAARASAFLSAIGSLIDESKAALWPKLQTSSMVLMACASAIKSASRVPAGLTVAHRSAMRVDTLRKQSRATVVSDIGLLRKALPEMQLSASGGVYTGLHALDYILSGASTVQIYSLVAGRVSEPPKRSFNKFEQVLYKLLLDPSDGLVAGLLHLKNTRGISGVRQAVGAAS